jgi:phosphopantothenoylcysteine decarboxylase / phosphopantothenate---cysteine ligase
MLISAGPTHESIDPVRYIGNHSTGKMGYAIAEASAMEGADVILVSGPSGLEINHPNIQKIDVTSASEMAAACVEQYESCRVGIMTAAVADFTPKVKAAEKIKSSSENTIIELEPTTDIAAALGKVKREDQVLVGFALETENEKDNALEKIRKKNFDFIVLNSLRDNGAGFGYDTNKVCIIDTDNNVYEFELKSKKEVAGDIINKLIEYV